MNTFFGVSTIIKYKYSILFPAALVEGAFVMMLSGFLVKMGYLAFIPAFVVLLLGDIIGDVIWYYIGLFGGHALVLKFGGYFGVHENDLGLVTRIFHKYKEKILFISKITGGFGFSIATLLTAGLVKIPLGKFIIINTVGEIIWTALCMSIGYFFGSAYVNVASIGGKIFLFSALAFIGFVLFRVTKSVREKIKKM